MANHKMKASTYNLFLIPENSSRIRKLRFSERQLRLLVVASVISVLFLVFNLFGFVYYRSLYASLEKDRLAVAAFEKEKKDLVTKVAVLEKTVTETERLAGELASMVGTERVDLKKGIGPIPWAKFDVMARTAPVSLAALDPKLELLEDRAATLQGRIKELHKIQGDKLIYMASTPSVWPVKGWVTSDFGYRRSPFGRAPDFHAGIDIAASWGTPVLAPADGIVTFTGYKGGFGKMVVIDHGFGVTTRFAHTSEMLAQVGQKVKRGALIAKVGSTGHSTGPHLHYEIHVDGVPMDPMKYLYR